MKFASGPVETSKGKLARRLLVIAHHMLKEGRDYEPGRLSRAA